MTQNLNCLVRALILCALPLVGSGCFMYATREDFQIAQKDIADLKERLKTQEERHASDLARMNSETGEQVKKMKEATEKAAEVVTRNSANLGQDVDSLKAQMATLTGRVEVGENTLNVLSKSFNDYRASSDTKLEKLEIQQPSAKDPPVPDTPDALFAEARKRYDAKEFPEARRLLVSFINRYSSDPRHPQAMYLLGDANFQEKKYPAAIGTFEKIVTLYPTSEIAPDAMYKNGMAFYALKYCGDARIYFQELLRRYPKTEWKKDAAEQIKKITRDQKNKELCQS